MDARADAARLLNLKADGRLLNMQGQAVMLSPRGLSGKDAASLLGLGLPQLGMKKSFGFVPDVIATHPKTPTQKPAAPPPLPAMASSSYLTAAQAPPPPSSAPPIAVAAPPSAQDLYELYRLCGGNQQEVMQLLARAWATSVEAIEPTVSAWLEQLPTPVPPSRSTSAPPIFKPFMTGGLPPSEQTKNAVVAKITRTPAASAPPNAQRVAEVRSAAIAGLNHASTRLNHSVSHRSGLRSGIIPPQVLALPQPTSFAPVLFTPAEVDAVPEEDENHAYWESFGGTSRNSGIFSKQAAAAMGSGAKQIILAPNVEDDSPLANVFVARQAALNSKLKPTEPLRGGSTRMRG